MDRLNTILKMMLTNPEKTLYARVYMRSAVITTFEANTSPEPTTSDSAPIIDLTGVGFTFVKLDPALADTFLGYSGGGRHITTARLLISEIPLETPPIEDLIALAKARKLPLDELRYCNYSEVLWFRPGIHRLTWADALGDHMISEYLPVTTS